MAPKGDVSILAKKVDITEARETSHSEVEQKFSQSGLTVAVSSQVLSAAQGAVQSMEAAEDTRGGRSKALAAANVGFAANNARGAVEAGQGSTINGQAGQIATGGKNPDGSAQTRDATEGDKAGGINLAISIGSSKSESRSTSETDTARGSTVKAGGKVTIAATGGGQDSNVLIQGSDVTAGTDVNLYADNKVTLRAAENTASQRSSNTSSSGSVGISFGTDGFLVTGSASRGKGHADGDDTWYSNTHVTAGKTLNIHSGGDTILDGAVASGQKVKADIGGNLLIGSRQDTSSYTSSQQNIGGSVAVGFGNSSASVSASHSRANSQYTSVGEQSGIKAGDGGFDVNVKGKTVLTGGVIASTDAAVNAGVNRFESKGGLELHDLQNTADYKATSVGVSVSTGGSMQSAGLTGTGIGLGYDKGHASSTTTSGISGIAGNTAVRSGDGPTGISKIFNADTVEKDVNAQVTITGIFGQQASTAAGQYANRKYIEASERGDIESAEKWGPSGEYRAALHGGVGALTGGLAGAAGAAGASMVAPKIGAALYGAGVPEAVAQGLTQVFVLGAAGAAGGAGAAAAAYNESGNNSLMLLARLSQLGAQAAQQGIGALTADGQALLMACARTSCSVILPAAVITTLTATSVAVSGSPLVDLIPGTTWPTAPDGLGGNTTSPVAGALGGGGTSTPGDVLGAGGSPGYVSGSPVGSNPSSGYGAGNQPVFNPLTLAVPPEDKAAINDGLKNQMGGLPEAQPQKKSDNAISRYPEGTWDDANRFFDNLPLQEIKVVDLTDSGEVRRGLLPNGTAVIVRPRSLDGAPTIEIQDSNRPSGRPVTVQEIRFGKPK